MNPNKHGRWFKRYLPTEAWEQLERTFAGAEIEDNWVALFNMTALFRQTAQEVARHFDYTYPIELDQKVTKYLHSIKNLERKV